ncbi:MAG: M24 family metallopeptidase, partial [Candidatus Heimdallarchaeota archaeon]
MSQAKIPRDLHLQVAKEKHEQVAAIMKEEDIDCWIVFVRSTAAIPDPVMELVVVGDIVWQSAFIFTLKDNKFTKTTLVGNFDVINEENKGIWDEVIGYKEGISEPFRKFIGDLNPKKIALNYSTDDVTADGLTYGLYMIISDILVDYKEKFTSSEKIIAKLRGRKSKTEIELVTKACIMTKEIYAKIFSQIKVGMSETEVQQMFYDEMERLEVESSWQRNSCPAVDAGPDKEIGHAGPKPDIYTQKGHTLH